MTIALTIIHVIVCFFLVIVVLLQSGKAADLAGAFGGMGSQTAFGPRGSATVLSKATTIAAAVFMVTSLYACDSGDAKRHCLGQCSGKAESDSSANRPRSRRAHWDAFGYHHAGRRHTRTTVPLPTTRRPGLKPPVGETKAGPAAKK